MIILLLSNLSRQHLKVLLLGVRRNGKAGKIRKVGVKKNWWVLALPPYSLQENWKQLPKVAP